ncbi:MAG TPA: T9SS type A sorting domain-containing protein [Candidatus Kapabacteria bacterium]|nr:T9SS type A sorting domain-containing protein [Candidatus Kapabacteria bacterium]
MNCGGYGTANMVSIDSCLLVYNDDNWDPSPFIYRTYPTQNIFLHPRSDTILYGFDTSGLMMANFHDCPLPDSNYLTWPLLKAAKNATYFLILPENPNILFFGADDTLWHSNDAGKTWNMAVTANINSVAYYPRMNVFVASASDSATKGLYRSIDGGKTFLRMDTTTLYAVAIDTANGAVYAGTDGALLRSNDTGKTLTIYNNTFTRYPIFSVDANVYGKLLCAASDGIYSILGKAVGVQQDVFLHDDAMLQNYPNPFSESTTIQIPSNKRIKSLKIFDALGREVADLSRQTKGGNFSITFDAGTLPSGLYVCRMVTDETVARRSMIITK